jgi:hypothetical protein
MQAHTCASQAALLSPMPVVSAKLMMVVLMMMMMMMMMLLLIPTKHCHLYRCF